MNSWGYGFKTPLNDLASKNKAGKSLVIMSNDEKLLPPLLTNNEGSLFVVANESREIVNFSVDGNSYLVKRKGNKLIQIPVGDLQKQPILLLLLQF